MTAQAQRVGEMSVEELRRLIADEVRSQLERFDADVTTDPIQPSALAAARQYIEEHRLTLPPGSPSVEELVRQERERWQR